MEGGWRCHCPNYKDLPVSPFCFVRQSLSRVGEREGGCRGGMGGKGVGVSSKVSAIA